MNGIFKNISWYMEITVADIETEVYVMVDLRIIVYSSGTCVLLPVHRRHHPRRPLGSPPPPCGSGPPARPRRWPSQPEHSQG